MMVIKHDINSHQMWNTSAADETMTKCETEELAGQQTEQPDAQGHTVPNLKFPYDDYGEDDQYAVYDRKLTGDVEENSQKLLEGLLDSADNLEELTCIYGPEDMIDPGEIYAISIYDGKVHVTGGEGYEDKAAAYEKLLNASLRCVWNWSWGGRAVREEQVLNKLVDTLHYYMDVDTKIRKADSNDSIVNHVGEAFEQWRADNRPMNVHFEKRA